MRAWVALYAAPNATASGTWTPKVTGCNVPLGLRSFAAIADGDFAATRAG